jgi:Tfp pilus assembly protein PilF
MMGAEIQISWEAVPEQNVLYRIYRSNNKTFSKDAFAVELELEKTRGFDRPKRVKNTAVFYYFVTALDRSGNESPPVVSDPVEVLGEVELNVKRFNEYKADVETRLRAEEFDKVLEMAAGVPTPLIQASEFAPYPAFWKAVAQARKVIRDDSGNGDALNSAKNDLENFLSQYSATPLASEAQSTLDEVKSKILWHQIMTYGMYGGGTLLILLFVWMGVRWNKRERATEMPMIQAGTDTEGITPSKEALKDPTVVRRWVEVQADPNTAENWSRLAFAFHNIGEIENAIQALYKAMEIEPNNTRFHFQMGHFQKESGKVKEAIRHFERYLALNPESKKSVEEVKELLAKLKQEPGGKE